MNRRVLLALLFAVVQMGHLQLNAAPGADRHIQIAFEPTKDGFKLADEKTAAPILLGPNPAKVIEVVAAAFARDVAMLCGRQPAVQSKMSGSQKWLVIAGQLGKHPLIDSLVQRGALDVSNIKGKWEGFRIAVIDKPATGVEQGLVVVGSDARGTAFGLFHLSRMMGLSPWYWWADVTPEKRNAVYVTKGNAIEEWPAVKFRGIFLNDEDWGLQPWAAGNIDTAAKDIGPNTYARIFELLLRLKGNYIWPAMHPCTKAFYYYPDNPKIANDYGIVVGSSHCEPMLRNNVFEWAENFEHEYGVKPGEWRYDLNQQQISTYWTDRVKQSANFENIYTVGMRGIHDGSMPGPKPVPEKVQLLQRIINDQRSMLQWNLKKPADEVSQIFCPYKEVLTVYRNGLQLPDDVTIVWADDNHGFIRQLGNAAERKRSGGSGVYYHLSYWGSPHDYLWLSTISPSLISFEMTKALHFGAGKLWVFNVGDIKPAELETQFALDLAWNPSKYPPAKAFTYVKDWAIEIFGASVAESIAAIKLKYYELAASGKPEHMASIQLDDEGAMQRLADYRALNKKASELQKAIPARLQDAYFELVLYPVQGACFMNEKILLAQKSLLLSAQQIPAAIQLASEAKAAFLRIQEITDTYNQHIAGGKWNGMMSWHPRDLAVFRMPLVAGSPGADSVIRRLGQPGMDNQTKRTKIKATQFVKMNGQGLQTIPGLGIHGEGIGILPVAPVEDGDTSLQHKPFAAYNIHLAAGEKKIAVKCLPTQSPVNGGALRYAIAIGNEIPKIVNVHAEAETANWKKNVLQGYSEGTTQHSVSQAGTYTLKIYLLDAGLVVNSIEIIQ